MMKFKRKVFVEKGQLDIAPLIDVVFLLLIFFMLTSSFIFYPGIRVNLPKAVTSEVLARDLFVVVVTSENELYVKERKISYEELESMISLITNEGRSVLIKADKDADVGNIIGIWDLCRKSGLKKISIATTQ